jgi:F0F1-type ATP synthase assembly protein I
MPPGRPGLVASDMTANGQKSPKTRPGAPPEQNAGWEIFSYLLSGMIVYGFAGWLVARLTQVAVLFPVGMLVGLAAAILLIVLKYGRP